MICLDSSIVVDYLNGASYVEQLLATTAEPVAVPRLVRYELYAGALRSDDPTETIDAVDQALDWTESLGFTEAAARDAARIRADLLAMGTPIGAADILIAGITRAEGATLITRDTDFERVPDLQLTVLDPAEVTSKK